MLLRLAQRLETEMQKEEPDYRKVMSGFPYFAYHSKRAYFHPLEEKEEDRRYVLCFNPEKFAEERKQRAEKITSIEKRFREWNQKLLKAKKARDKGRTEKEIFAYLEKRKAQGLCIHRSDLEAASKQRGCAENCLPLGFSGQGWRLGRNQVVTGPNRWAADRTDCGCSGTIQRTGCRRRS